MIHQEIKLDRFISNQFLKAALLPLLFIEVALVLLYFGVTVYNENQTKSTLEKISAQQLQETALSQSLVINEQLEDIATISGIMMKETVRFFEDPQSFSGKDPNVQFQTAPNGVYYKVNDNGGASLYYSKVASIADKEIQKARLSEALDPLYKSIATSNKNIVAAYLNTFDSMNRYYPFIKDVYQQFPADMNIPTYNFYYLADKQHNPSKHTVWTEAYLDPAGQGWMMSCISPIYKGDFLEGVVGIDVTIDQFIKNILSLRLPWGSEAFLVDAKGTIMAMPPKVEQIFDLAELRQHVYAGQIHADTFKPEEFNLMKSKNASLAKDVTELMKAGNGVKEERINNEEYLLTQATVKETGWKLFILTEKNKILAPVIELRKETQKIGFLAVGVMMLFYLFFFIYLIRHTRGISRFLVNPLSSIIEASQNITRGEYQLKLPKSNIQEFDTLSISFERMAVELQNLYIDLEKKVEERTRQLKDAQDQLIQSEKMASIGQLAAGVAHEINNPVGFISNNLEILNQYFIEYTKILKLTRELQQVIESKEYLKAHDLNEKLVKLQQELDFDYIFGDTGKILEHNLKGIDRIKKIIGDLLIFSRQGSDVLELIQIESIMETVLTVVHNEIKYKVELHKDFSKTALVRCNQQKMAQVFINLIVNSLQAIKDKGIIEIKTYEKDGNVCVDIKDNGCGISEKNLKKIFDPFFTTKPVGLGTGLGLSVSYETVKLYGGQIKVQSKEGVGTTFTVMLPFAK